MEKSKEEDSIVEIGSQISPPSAKRVRRCVQSKLPWCKPRAEEPKAVEVEENREDCEEKKKGSESPQSNLPLNEPQVEEAKVIVIEESGDCEESDDENKKKGKRRKYQRRTPKKSPVKNKETRGSITRNKGSRNCQQLKPGEESPTQSPISKNSNRGGSNSKKSVFNKRSNAAENDDGQNMITNHSLTNLRLEAKLAAEENVRLSAGKQTHPFFTSRKAAKRLPETQITTKMEMRCWPGLDGDYTVSCPPVHVFDTLGDDVASLDWKNWVFMETSLSDLNGYGVIENASTAFDGSVKPLIFDSLRHERIDLHQLSDKVEGSTPFLKCTSITTNGPPLSNVEDHYCNSSFFSSSRVSLVSNPDYQQHDRLLMERLTSYYRRISCWPECSLWTNKYQPENASEVCGNSDSVRSLGEWLKSWHEKVPQSSKQKGNWEPNAAEDGEDSIYEIESDMDDEATLKNVLLITGPVGSGKSAAIYACAKEQGFEVIEVNTSDLRNGAHMKQEFGQAMDSHSLNKWSFEDLNGRRKKHIFELLSNPADIKQDEEFENGSIEEASRSCEQTATFGQPANKTLILFEDVDTVFDEDRGFISSILQLAETAKRPIILTSNYRNPVLPQILYRFVLDFTLPSSAELLSHLCMICASEKAHISSGVLEHLVTFCLGDIRKALMLLQFWCQGNDLQIERNIQISVSPLAFDIDAAHLVVPRLIPWELNCKLSEKIADEIDNTIAMVEENLWNMEVMEQELSSVKPTKPRKKQQNNVATPVKARKKKTLLKRNQSSLDSTEFLDHANCLHDFSDASDSPITNAQQTITRMRGIILSSQSDDGSADEFPCTDTMQDKSTAPISQTRELNLYEPPVDPICHHERDSIGRPLENFETASVSHVCDTFKMQDVSCVPESSFFSGTETNGEDAFLAISSYNTSFNLDDSILPGDNNDFNRIVNELSKCLENNVGNTCDIEVESVDGNEELGDSQKEGEESLFNQFHLMDECSRADFNMRFLPGGTSKCLVEVDSVQETWRKLRCRDDLKSCLLANRKDVSLIVKHASELANLISEADIMFKSCYPLVNDILDQSMMPCDEPDICSYYEQQMEMGSAYSEYGLCYHTSKFVKLGSIVGHESKMDLAQEMLASSTNTMSLRKLLSHGNTTQQNSSLHREWDVAKPGCSIPTGREMESPLYNAILPTVPARLTMALRGSAFHEYFSFMSKISKLELSRLSESVERRKRSRASRHYLSSGPFSLSDEDVQLLAQSCCFRSSTMRTS